MLRSVVACLLALLCASCSTLRPVPPPHTVVLVSFDGFRAGELGQGRTPNLDAMAHDGVSTPYMRPSYPTLTFPNHYTLVTGLRPDHHGIVQNTIEDATLGRFTSSDEAANADPRWWGGEPLWSTAQNAGVRSATMFWPGSSAPIAGVRPWAWQRYDEHVTGEARVDTALGWLAMPASERPRFVTLYFEALDEAAHDHGPDSNQSRRVVGDLDTLIGRLRVGIDRLGLAADVDLIVVSDHGMAAVPPGHGIAIDSVVPASVARAVTAGESLGFRPLPGQEDAARRLLLGRHDHYECWTRETLPARWHYGSNPRIPPIVCQTDEGWDIQKPETLAKRSTVEPRGAHGFDPDLPSMHALFVAAGPSFRRGAVIAPFDNVDLYPLLARLLGVAPRPNDGDPAALLPALRTP